MHVLRGLLPFLYFLGIIPAAMGLFKLSKLAAALGPQAPGYVMGVGGGALLILWIILVVRSVNQANEAFEQHEIAKANITASWQRNSARPLEVDLKKLTLGNVPLGGDMQGLSFLGPAEDAKCSPYGQFCYNSRGLYLETKDGRLTAFDFDVDSFLASPGTAIYADGIGTKLHPGTSEAELVAVLGAPYWRVQHEDRARLFFERFNGERWLELELRIDATGRLDYIDVRDTPTLADARMRRQYNVTVEWPPGGAARRAS
jgi:hypothetical protein